MATRQQGLKGHPLHTPARQSDVDSLNSAFVTKLARFLDLTAAERAALWELQAGHFIAPARTEIVAAGYTYRGLLILNKGTAIRYKVLRDGRRQILGLSIPGDFVGFPGCLFEKCLYSTSTLEQVVACSVPFEKLFALFREHPRLGTAIFWLAGHESAHFTEHLVCVGRQSAYERVAYFLLELLVRLQSVGLAGEDSYVLPLTQELMADALGLSIPHVNKMLRELRADHLIALSGTRLTILDVPALSAIAAFNGRNLMRQKIPNL
jgi:CRP-like cAMP-binding protein